MSENKQMITTQTKQKPIHSFINENKNSFISYNIAHLREVIRYLSAEKFELFHTLPFLLHVNSPQFPGYVSNPNCKYGIYGFQDSGFWKLALKHFKYSEKELFPCLAKKYFIKGLYLMGSSGTLAQGDNSDLDYWVLVDEEINNNPQKNMLNQKLSLLEEWAQKTYKQQVSFFILSTEQVKDNSFTEVDEESSGTIQQTILKEEFYRTFIMIAGLIPYWTILPVSLDDAEYHTWIHQIESDYTTIKDDIYIDLGNPAPINTKECPGALLWQLYKARHDPVKSYIKASLIAYYYFSKKNVTLPCDEIKKKFSDKMLDSYTVDPYSIIFNRTLDFYHKTNDLSRLELLRECLFLRLHGYPLVKSLEKNSPKEDLLKVYLKKWDWSDEKRERFLNYKNWTETDKLDYEVRIISRISTLYKEIQKNSIPSQNKATKELLSVQNRISSVFKTRPNKIPRCSSYIKAMAESGKLVVVFKYNGQKENTWTIYERYPKDKKKLQRRLFIGSGLCHLVSWISCNKLHLNIKESIILDVGDHYLSKNQAMIFIEKAYKFMGESPTNQEFKAAAPSWQKVLIAIEARPPEGNNNYEGFDIIIKNTWGELFHRNQNLKDIENNLLKCYKLSKILYQHMKNESFGNLQYLILIIGVGDETYAQKTILDFIHQFQNEAPDQINVTTGNDSNFKSNGKKPETPLLDLL